MIAARASIQVPVPSCRRRQRRGSREGVMSPNDWGYIRMGGTTGAVVERWGSGGGT